MVATPTLRQALPSTYRLVPGCLYVSERSLLQVDEVEGDVGLEEGEYRENCLCLAVLCIIIMVHKGTSSSYRSVNCIRL